MRRKAGAAVGRGRKAADGRRVTRARGGGGPVAGLEREPAVVRALLSDPHILRAAAVLARGGVVAYPTEGVYGLGCDPFDSAGLEHLIRLKGRDPGKGFIVIAARPEQLAPLVRLPEGKLRADVLATWPGPVTWVLAAADGVPRRLRRADGTLAVRLTAHPPARALCLRAGPLVSTSANRAGARPALDAFTVRRRFGRALDGIVAGPTGGLGGPTEIRDARTGRVLRSPP